MNWIADENIDRSIVLRLRADGHEVLYVAEASPGISDLDLLDLAESRDRIVLTADKAFGDWFMRPGIARSGLVIVRLAGLSSEQKSGILIDAVRREGERLRGALTVITAGGSRTHRVIRPS